MLKKINRKSFFPQEMLEDCGIEAAGDHKLAITEVKDIYRYIAQAVSFVNGLKPNQSPKYLTTIAFYAPENVEGWSDAGFDFIRHLQRASFIRDELSGLTPYAKPHPTIQALAEISERFSLNFPYWSAAVIPDQSTAVGARIFEAFKELVEPERIARLKRLNDNSRRNCNKNHHSLAAYLMKLLAKKKRLLVLRLDLYYSQKCSRDFKKCSHERISADRDSFFKLLRKKYPAYVGYAWKLEIGIQRRWHLHTLLCFDGRKLRLDALIGKSLGKKWREITHGDGDYFNCNAVRGGYKFDAIGELRADDQEKISHLMHYPVSYLTKTDHLIRLELPEGARAFGKGQIPHAWSKNGGGEPNVVDARYPKPGGEFA